MTLVVELTDQFADLEKLDVSQLHVRREQIRAEFSENYNKMPDDKLTELLAITRLLRKKAAAPGGAGKSKKSPKGPTSLEDLA